MLLDADEKQARNSELSTWLGQLKVILYEMEDFLDDLELEVLQKQVANREGTKEKRKKRLKMAAVISPA